MSLVWCCPAAIGDTHPKRRCFVTQCASDRSLRPLALLCSIASRLRKPLSYFDQASASRLSDAKLTQLADGPTDGPLAILAAEARTALVDRDAQRIHAIARSLREAASGDEYLAIEASAALLLAGA